MKEFSLSLFSILFAILFIAGCSLESAPANEDQNSKLTKYIDAQNPEAGKILPSVMGDNESAPDGIQEPDTSKNEAILSANQFKPMAYGSSASLAVPQYYQETSYWCGPGSAQMVQYYFGMGCSQTRIATYCGTTSSSGTSIYSLAKWFNDAPMTGYASLPSWWQWVVEYLDTYQEFLNCMGTSFYNYRAPEIWNVCTYPSSTYRMPGYTFNGRHYVCGKGYNSTSAIYNDPWYGSGGGPNRSVAKYTMYYCIKANKGLIIY